MTSNEVLSDDDKKFLAKCEEELKHRYTENDEEFNKIFNAEASKPPIVECWFPQSQGRRNDRRHNRRPYERYDNRNKGYHDRSYNSHYNDRGSRDYDSGYNRGRRYNHSHY